LREYTHTHTHGILINKIKKANKISLNNNIYKTDQF